MSTAHVNARATQNLSVEVVDSKLEIVVIPVADVERAKRFYRNLGWRLDTDFAFDNGVRVVQFTPPGSQCSIPDDAAEDAALNVERTRGTAPR